MSSNNTNDKKWLEKIPSRIGYYLAGFVDGEGSFNVSVKKRDNCRREWKIEASFNVSQKERVILALLKRWLGCGTLRERRDGVIYYEVRNIKALKEKVIPFFERFRFLSAKKKRNFSIFKRIVKKMNEGKHLTPEGLKEIMELRESLNQGRGRKRKYSITDVIKK